VLTSGRSYKKSNLYNAIANLVFCKVDGERCITEERRQQIKKAKHYVFKIVPLFSVKLWGDVPIVTAYTFSDPSSLNVSRRPVDEVYDKIG
jgi:hypothetical protein